MRKTKNILSVTLALIMALSTLLVGTSAITANAATKPVKVTLVSTVYNTNATVTLGWTAAAGASGYQIAKKRITDKGYTYLTAAGTSYNDKKIIPGTIYYYQVRSIYKSGKTTTYGAWSNSKSITTLYRPDITNLRYLNGNMLNINWNKIMGISHYKLAFKRSTDKVWNYRDVKSTYYNVPNATRGARYYVQVCPMNGNLAGRWSSVAGKLIGINYYKPTIKDIYITDHNDYQDEDDYLVIDWTFPIECDCCEIYFKKASDADWSISFSGFEHFDGESLEYLNMDAWEIEPGNTYYFQVRAIDDEFSKFSNVYSFYVPEVQKS